MKRKRLHIVVEGATPFPIDMLRYDGCWPANEKSSYKIAETYFPETRGMVTVELFSDVCTQPTEGRWNSFGWRVKQWKAI